MRASNGAVVLARGVLDRHGQFVVCLARWVQSRRHDGDIAPARSFVIERGERRLARPCRAALYLRCAPTEPRWCAARPCRVTIARDEGRREGCRWTAAVL